MSPKRKTSDRDGTRLTRSKALSDPPFSPRSDKAFGVDRTSLAGGVMLEKPELTAIAKRNRREYDADHRAFERWARRGFMSGSDEM